MKTTASICCNTTHIVYANLFKTKAQLPNTKDKIDSLNESSGYKIEFNGCYRKIMCICEGIVVLNLEKMQDRIKDVSVQLVLHIAPFLLLFARTLRNQLPFSFTTLISASIFLSSRFNFVLFTHTQTDNVEPLIGFLMMKSI